MSDTPLSDLVSRVVAEGPSAFAAFFAVFLRSNLGVLASGPASERPPSETLRAAGDDVAWLLVLTPDGRRMIKACADPPVFAQRYPDPPLSAVMLGSALLTTLMASQQAEGILVCSATSLDSLPIARGDVPKLLLAAAPKGGWSWRG